MDRHHTIQYTTEYRYSFALMTREEPEMMMMHNDSAYS